MATFHNSDYLKFDAISIKNAIIQRLSEDMTFTDQLFEGSNLTILIDTFAYMFEVLQYYINHGSSEAMFTDVQLYENMNRIVKMLGYNPAGIGAAQVRGQITGSNITGGEDKILPKYTTVNSGLTDSYGSEIFYSTVDNNFVEDTMSAEDDQTVALVNGRWKLYDRTFSSTGTPLETFTLDLLDSEDEDSPVFVAHPYVDIFVKRTVDDGDEYIPFTAIANGTLFASNVSIYGPDENVFELRLNENKKYEIKFGDGIHGAKLQENDEIYIFYLKCNGTEGAIGANILNSSSPKSIGVAGLSEDLFWEMMDLDPDTDIVTLDNMAITNIDSSTFPTDIESVDDIRENAPNWFRMGARLVTARDFKQYIESTYRNDVYDTSVMNNWTYMVEFQKWLHDLGYLTNSIKALGYVYADSCDFNNVYVWIKFKQTINTEIIENDLQARKVMTCEPIIVDALDMNFVPCHTDGGYSTSDWDPNVENWIEILKDKNSTVPAEKIKQNAMKVISDYFSADRNYIGQLVNFNELYSDLRELEGVKRVSTVYSPTGSDETYYYDGVRMATWTDMIVGGSDLGIRSGNVQLKEFQFPVLDDALLESRVQVVFESFGQPSIEY